jgi:hypothetical protein
MMFTLMVNIVRLKSKKLMSKLRREKRKAERNHSKANAAQQKRTQHFSNICLEFSTILLNNKFDMDSEAVNNAFDKYNKEWKEYARKEIKHDPRTYNKPKIRSNFINGFETFVNKYIDDHVKPMHDLKESVIELANDPSIKPGLSEELAKNRINDEEKDMRWFDYEIPIIKEALSVAGISTQARTIKGLTPIIKNLDEYESRIFKGELGLL